MSTMNKAITERIAKAIAAAMIYVEGFYVVGEQETPEYANVTLASDDK